MTTKQISVLAGAGLLFLVAIWFWLADFDARRNGVPLVGTYSGNFEKHFTNSRFGSRRTSARLIVEFTSPDGVSRSAELLDLTDLDKIPPAGTKLEIVWLPDAPETARKADAIAGPLGVNAAWMGGIAALIFVAQIADVLSSRRRQT